MNCTKAIRFAAGHITRGAILSVALLVPGGCSKPGIERVVVTGTVNYRDMPVEKGEIEFVPEGQLPTTIARITQGTYRVVAKGGVPVGDHRVRIKAFRVEDAPQIDLAVGESSRQFLPARYNRETELLVTIESTHGEAVRDFHLK